MNNPRISAGQPTNLLASLDALTQFTWNKLFRLTRSGKVVAFNLTWGVIPTLRLRASAACESEPALFAVVFVKRLVIRNQTLLSIDKALFQVQSQPECSD